MTTVIATRQALYADTFCNYTVPFKMTKIARIGDSIYAGAADDFDSVVKLFWWLRGEGPKPKLPTDEAFDVIELGPAGIFLWSKHLTRTHIDQDCYAIGSGGQYAMGAIGAGANPIRAIDVAAMYDPNTKPPVETVNLKEST